MHKVKTDASMSQSAIRLRRLRITNAVEIASRTYTYDALGSVMSRVQRCSEAVRNDAFSYNPRSELTAATLGADAYAYDFDDIGNRTTATAVGVNTAYTANSLNQYTAVGSFTPTFDADGNQTKIQTATGVWVVDYNAENRPVRWTQGNKVITMTFDRMGRRVAYVEKNGETIVQHDRFVYDNYLCIQRLDAMQNNSVRTRFVWDPTEAIATRPLFMRAENWNLNLFYSHDGNKNVSEVFYYANQNGIAAHYDYAPFGTVIRTARTTRVTNRDIISENPFRFSSEAHDDALALVYYNYRHYNPADGRWLSRDPSQIIVSEGNEFRFLKHTPQYAFDIIGLFGDGYMDVCIKYETIYIHVQGFPVPIERCAEKKTIPSPYKGHKQFTNNGTECPFDYAAEDSGWSSPFNPFSTWRHFRDKADVEGALETAIQSCDAENFASYMHQYQDHETHYGKNYRWYKGGHMFAGTKPDEDNKAWGQAEKDTKKFVDKWNINCCLVCPKSKCKWTSKSSGKCAD